jgi:hypothetical protein
MQIESILRAILVADPVVSGMVGTRAHQGQLPQGPTFPAIVYQMISRPQDGLTGIVQARMQYTCMAESWREAADLADAVRCCLHGYRGVQDGARIEYIQYAGQHDDYDETTGIHWIPVDVIVTYLEET